MKFSKFGRLVLGLSILILAAYAPTVSAAGGYHLIKKVPLATTRAAAYQIESDTRFRQQAFVASPTI